MLQRIFKLNSSGLDEPFHLRIKKRPFEYLYALLLLVNISLIFVNIGIIEMAARQKLFSAADFTSFYTAAYMVRHGEADNIYDLRSEAKYQQQLLEGLTFEGGVLPFANPPTIALILVPLTILPLNIAYFTWLAIQVILLIWFLFTIYHLFPGWTEQERAFLIITILAFWPLTHTLLLGQFALILSIILMQVYKRMMNMQLTRAGFWLALLAIKPPVLLVPGVVTLNKRNWKMALVAAATGAIFVIVTILLLGVKPWIQFAQNLLTMSNYNGEYGVIPGIQYTLRGAFSNMLGSANGQLTNIISLVILLAGMVIVWALWMRVDIGQSLRFRLYFAFSIALSAFISIHAYPHDDLILVLPVAIFYDYLREMGYSRRIFTLVVLISPAVFLFSAFNHFNILGVIRPPLVIIAIILTWMAIYLLKDLRNQENKTAVNP